MAILLKISGKKFSLSLNFLFAIAMEERAAGDKSMTHNLSIRKKPFVKITPLGHSKWIIFSPCSRMTRISQGNIYNFSLSYWEANSYYPRGPIMERGSSSNFKIGWDRGFSMPGAFKLDHLQPFEPIFIQKIFNFFTFVLRRQFLLPQRANNWKI